MKYDTADLRSLWSTESDYYTYETVELTETEEERTEDSVAQVTDYYNITSRPSPGRQMPLSSQSSSYDEAYRFNPHELYPKLTERPPRQEQSGGGGGRHSPRKTPTPSPSSQRGRYISPGRRELPTPRSTPPRTSTRSLPRSSPVHLPRTPSPAPRGRPHSLSPVSMGNVGSSPRRRRRQSAAGRVTGPTRRSPARSPAPFVGRGGEGASPVRVRSENVVQETTEIIDERGVVYRQEVTDTVHELSVSTPSDSDY